MAPPIPSVVVLKGVLRKMNLVTTGSKADLVARLYEADPTGAWLTENDDMREDEDGDDESHFDPSINVVPPKDDTVNAGGSGLSRQSLTAADERKLLLREVELVRREKDFVEREVQMMHRELQIARAMPNSVEAGSVNSRPNVNIRAISDLLSDFTGKGERFLNWERKVLLLRQTYALDDNLSKILVSSRLKGTALT